MIIQILNLNWASVILAFAVYFILGALWFTVFFKNQYAISLGRQNEPQDKPKPIFIIGPAICTLIITITCASFIYSLGINSLTSIIEFSLFLGFGLLVSNTMNIAINPNIPRPIYYGIISGSYHLIGILLSSLIIYYMK